ncbi:MAG: hypothetical protein PHG08_01920 [Bacilli bacterium]|jgi:hypothetical protein|nr:hypothetical protein [Bacilli bacterium]HHU24231.1 hypothetical protein [Acholeplasmataceae bacterium]
MNNKKQLMAQIRSDINRLGGNYPIMAIYKNNRFVDYTLSTEVKVVDDENSYEMTLIELLHQLENDDL